MVWDVNPIAFHVGSFGVRYYSLFVAVVWIGVALIWAWQSKRGGYPESCQYNLLPFIFFGALFGARLSEILFYQWDKFLADPMLFFRVWKGGLSSHGAAVFGILTMILYGRYYKMGILESLDRSTLSAAVWTIMVRFGNFFNSEIVGRATDMPWGIRFIRYDSGVVARHPVMLYEALVGLIILVGMLLLDHRLKEDRPNGIIFFPILLVYFLARFFLEYTKEYMVFRPGSPFTMGQLLSIPFILVGVIGMVLALKGKTGKPRPADETRALFEHKEKKKKKKK